MNARALKWITRGLLTGAVFALAWLLVPVMRPPGGHSEIRQDLPWQITPAPNGSITVFGLTLGHSTLAEAVRKLGRRYELGLFEDPDGHLTLEAYFRDAVLGGLNARLVLTATLEPARLEALRTRAGPGQPLSAGGRRFALADADAANALTAAITSITYLPLVKLEAELIERRFGPPVERIQIGDMEHWLYPNQGLDLGQGADGRAVLQYLPPYDFSRLRAPLFQAGKTPAATLHGSP
jgi:hypothetical protein